MTPNELVKQYLAKQTQTKSLRIYNVRGHIYDIFAGDGWMNHTRFANTNQRWQFIAGNRLSSGLMRELNNVKITSR